jgi:hypothetical protein
MDFSLLQPGSRNTGLRDILAFPAHKWMYYTIIPLNSLLRFPWIFLAIFSRNLQHGSVVSFAVAFAEVTRRGLWTVFRVENEHCSNIAVAKAWRDVPLPYEVPQQQNDESTASLLQKDRLPQSPESGRKAPGKGLGLFRSMSRRLARAHAEDFTRRKRPQEMESHTPTREVDQTLGSDGEGSEAEGRIEEVNEERQERRGQDVRQALSGGDVHRPPPT